MRETFPHFAYRPNRCGGVTWTGHLQPTDESRVYSVRIVHDLARPPRVFVDGCPLDARCGHLYRDGSLCLYWPKEWRWGPTQYLAESLVPWAALWLYYYEAWLASGDWLGPSSPHGIEQKGQDE